MCRRSLYDRACWHLLQKDWPCLLTRLLLRLHGSSDTTAQSYHDSTRVAVHVAELLHSGAAHFLRPPEPVKKLYRNVPTPACHSSQQCNKQCWLPRLTSQLHFQGLTWLVVVVLFGHIVRPCGRLLASERGVSRAPVRVAGATGTCRSWRPRHSPSRLSPSAEP